MWGDDPVTFLEANRVWFKVAMAGSKAASVGYFWGVIGRVGLLGSIGVWTRYRLEQRGAWRHGP
jgi:hypothetical protein